jgi:hypothetical protein
MRSAIDHYTTDTLRPLEAIAVPQRDIVTVTEKLLELKRALAQGSAVSVALSKEEVAALPWSDLAPPHLRNQVALSLVGNEITARFAFRLSDVGSFGVASAVLASRLARGVEGNVAATLSIKNSAADLRLTRLQLQGHSFEDVALDGATVWCKGALESYLHEYAAVSARLQLLEVKGQTLVVQVSPLQGVTDYASRPQGPADLTDK